jgi:topoisomerase-4 subunit B
MPSLFDLTPPTAGADTPAPQPVAAKPAPAPVAAPAPAGDSGYSAKDIEVLEGLEPVRKRPGMYIGGTDERALHHLFAEVLDNAMDEAVAGFAKRITVRLHADGSLEVSDDGRGIPVDPHPKFRDKSALEVILTTLHSGGKFSSKVYQTSGGLHGVGVSVVNALSEQLTVEVGRDGVLYRQDYARGTPQTPLQTLGPDKRRGTTVRFLPDTQIFNGHVFKSARLMRMARAKAYLFRGVEIRWFCAPERAVEGVPTETVFKFPNGLADFLKEKLVGVTPVTPEPFTGRIERDGGTVEWAMAWSANGFGEFDGFSQSYCNTVPTPEGGTHESGLRTTLTKGLKAYAELVGDKRGALITADDVMVSAGSLISIFIREPEFQGQTKEKLSSPEAARLVEAIVRDPFDHWLTGSRKNADALLAWVVERAEERLKRRKDKEVARASATRKLRLPGKLADCARQEAAGTELFLVEGDSAGGSAKQARDRATQAILPLRGKILNVASATGEKAAQNQELKDLVLALGVETGQKYRDEALRYERIIIMTDADVDGAHIATLLITFFYRAVPNLIRAGKLYLAMPPLYRISHGAKSVYARDDAHKDELLATEFKGKKVDIGRFKGLGEMSPPQLKETTMNHKTRTLIRVELPSDETDAADMVETLMGRKPELRYAFITERAAFVEDVDI